jgi:AcrR family transcriptional regulator
MVDVAFREVGQAGVSELLDFLTPERIVESAEEALTGDNVRYHFHKPKSQRQFDREALFLELLERACDQVAQASRKVTETHLANATAMESSGEVAPLYEAVAAGLEHYRPGAEDPAVDAREVIYFLGIALCDHERSVAQQLRATDEQTESTFARVYERFLDMTGRRIAAGYSVRDLAKLISMLLNGESMRYRYGNSLPLAKVADAGMRLFWALTTPEGEEDWDIEQDVRTAIRRRRERP